jgi:hypothetical protein
LSQDGEVDPRGVGKQYEREGDLAQQEHGVVVEPELDKAEPCGTEDHTRRDEHDRRREDRTLQLARNEAEGEDDAGKDDEVNHRNL